MVAQWPKQGRKGTSEICNQISTREVSDKTLKKGDDRVMEQNREGSRFVIVEEEHCWEEDKNEEDLDKNKLLQGTVNVTNQGESSRQKGSMEVSLKKQPTKSKIPEAQKIQIKHKLQNKENSSGPEKKNANGPEKKKVVDGPETSQLSNNENERREGKAQSLKKRQ